VRLQAPDPGAPVTLPAATGAALVVERLPILVAAVGESNAAPDPPGRRPGSVTEAEVVLRREGRGALLPFQDAPGMSLYLSRSGRAVVAYARAGRMDIVLGDPVGPSADTAAAMAEFVRLSRRAHREVAIYQATAAVRAILAANGFRRIVGIGQEAIVDLTTFGLAGPPRANLRHTVTRFRRDGSDVLWFENGLDDASLAELGGGLAAIDVAWRRAAGPALGFTMHSFRDVDLRTAPIAVAIDPSGQAVGFVTFLETGSDGGYVVDVIRRLPGSVPGAVETCIAEAAMAMRDIGAIRLSLGLAPIHGLDRHRGPYEEQAIRTAADAVRRWYDIAGLAFFKDKFAPTWEPRYLAVRHRHDALRVTIALLRLHLAPGGSLVGAARNIGGTVIRLGPQAGAAR